jgi:ribosome-interacting GTPase 1
VPDYSAPVVIRGSHCSVGDLAGRIHKSLIQQMKHALVWGSSVRHQPQRVGKDHILVSENFF